VITGQALRAWRRSRGWDVPETARQLRRAARESGQRIATSQSLVQMIYAWERGAHRLTERYELLYAAALKVDPPLLSHGPERSAAEQLTGEPGAQPGHETAGDTLDVLGRVHRLSRSVDPLVIGTLADGTQRCLSDYEELDHSGLVPVLVRQRAWLESLLEECGDPRQRQRLFEIAGRTSGLLGYIAVGRGDFPLARAYSAEAFHLGDSARDVSLQAWACGTQSFCEYYARRYDDALTLAIDGLQYAGTGPQSVRLMINGAARALGKLGDADGVKRSVGRAYDLMARNNPPGGLPSSISLGCYSPAQAASNAATAYLSLGMPDQVQHYIERALPDIDQNGSPWSRSLVMIDLASSLTRSKDADLERAAELIRTALAISRDRPVISVRQRATEFIREATSRWGHSQQISAIRDATAALEAH